ncbi:MAG TPA: geranylgeranylglyceryl/heptaprenylglyceryl phosphate synthase [Thermoplasmatales archaeon]|nr:geranylgeranylglyceryl/heptaprenylglyceryl phosphate synthase [Thermoplasmatales archaeon]HEX17112.1 geranylgeranylglyceryl/heptaprenylglyceryl phosphate synthase [Thermoplasmatales archaeon]
MKVLDYLMDELEKYPLHLSLIDPEKQSPEEAGEIAEIAEKVGSTAIMVGGSTISETRLVDETVKEIKSFSSLPVILFPCGVRSLSKYADAVFFMSLLNSRNPRFIVREQAEGALLIRDLGIEPISMGYIVIEPGMRVGEVGEADPIRRNDLSSAVKYALAAQYFGMKFVYLEAGSGAKETVPNEMIVQVRKNIEIPLIVGGGIRDPSTAREKVMAGADMIVTGTALEELFFERRLSSIVKTIRSCKRV